MNNNYEKIKISEEMFLNYHLMHPGGESEPGDPNAVFFIDGTYHLHYIIRHTWHGTPTNPPSSLVPFKHSYSFIHVTSNDMLHWKWNKTKLQPSFTGHGMFSGTGFMTKDDQPAIIYHGYGSERNHIVLAKDRMLSDWENPFSVEPKKEDGEIASIRYWDPDCFIINNTYYAISGGREQPLFKSQDLVNWSFVGNFLKHEMSDVAIGEDISCPNFFKIRNKWMLLCISHPFGCRYYIGDWDSKNEQFIPETHGRMNWPHPDQSIYETENRDFFAPESVLIPDGRRIMWAWLRIDNIRKKTIQSLPRELSLTENGSLRISPIRELESLRNKLVTINNITVTPPEAPHGNSSTNQIAKLDGDSYEIKITIDRNQAYRKRFSFQIFSGNEKQGFPVMIHPESRTIRIGTTEAPFAVEELPEDEDLELRIFIDKYLIEVFANNRQAVVGTYMEYKSANSLSFYVYGDSTTIRKIEIWKLKATNQGLLDAIENPIWEPKAE